MSFDPLSTPQTAVLLQNNNTPFAAGWGVLDAESGLIEKVTVLVTDSGSPTSYSIDIVVGNVLSGPNQVWTRVQTITAPGLYTVTLGGVARYVSAAVTAFTGSGYVSATAAARSVK